MVEDWNSDSDGLSIRMACFEEAFIAGECARSSPSSGEYSGASRSEEADSRVTGPREDVVL